MKIKATITALSLATALGGGYTALNDFDWPQASTTPQEASMAALDVAQRRIEVDALAARSAIELAALADERRRDMTALEAERRQISRGDLRSERVAWVWETAETASGGALTALYGLVGVVSTATGGLVIWKVVNQAYLDRRAREFVMIDGAIPVSADFVRNRPDLVFEWSRERALIEANKRIQIAQSAPAYPNLATLTTNHAPTYSPTTTTSSSITNDKELLLTARATQQEAGVEDSGGVGAGDLATAIYETLQDLSVKAHVSLLAEGPQVDTYAVRPGREIVKGRYRRVDVGKVVRAADNLAIALNVASVRMEQQAGYVACEVPRAERTFVHFDEIGAVPQASHLPMVVGRDVANEDVIIDLCDAPHLLIGGMTGMGKSVVLQCLIRSLCVQSPDKVRLVLVDPKTVEFAAFSSIPHVKRVVTDMDECAIILSQMLVEMDRRAKMFAEVGVQKITKYNEIEGIAPLPFIVVIIDELADLMDTHRDEVEDPIVRLAQKARFAGIHLILATQRPDAETITPRIRGNMGVRISVRTATGGDSRTILGETGAENLLDKGDLLLKTASSATRRIQGAFIEAKEVVNAIELAHSAKETKVSPVKLLGNSGETSVKLGGNLGETGVKPDFKHDAGNRQTLIDGKLRKPDTKPDMTEGDRDSLIKELIEAGRANTEIQVAVWGCKGGKKYKERVAKIKSIRAGLDFGNEDI